MKKNDVKKAIGMTEGLEFLWKKKWAYRVVEFDGACEIRTGQIKYQVFSQHNTLERAKKSYRHYQKTNKNVAIIDNDDNEIAI